MNEQQLEGLWSYTSFEEGGKQRRPDIVAKMAKVVFLVGNEFPGWDGLWAIVTYGFKGETWSELEVKSRCRSIILGPQLASDPSPADFYLYAGGRYRIFPHKSPKEIDFEPYCQGTVLPPMTLGLYDLHQEGLTLCLAEAGQPRPSAFSSKEHAYQSRGELVRKSSAD